CRSKLRVRLLPDALPALLALAGKSIDLDGCRARLGVPQVTALVSALTLFARTVVLKASSPRIDAGDRNSRTEARPDPKAGGRITRAIVSNQRCCGPKRASDNSSPGRPALVDGTNAKSNEQTSAIALRTRSNRSKKTKRIIPM